jgi:hypothetical protein
MACTRNCHSDDAESAPQGCGKSCAKIERLLHNIVRPGKASLGLIDAQMRLLGEIGTASLPRL